MSGGGSGGGSGGPGVPADDGIPCEQLVFEAHLQSPSAAIVAMLAVGDSLEVRVAGQAIGAYTPAGVAGWIVDRLPQLLRCLQAGHAFQAQVLSIAGGAVRVRVTPA